MAPWSRLGRLYPGVLKHTYGKLAYIAFDDGDEGWALLTRLLPSGVPHAAPNDSCGVKPGQRVEAPWSRDKKVYPGIVADTYGKLAFIDFADNGRGWAACAETKVIDNKLPPPVSVGARVKAPWSRAGALFRGQVTEVYGKYAHIQFDDGDQGWALVTRLRPPGAPQPDPADQCTIAPGTKVSAPWSKTRRMFPGKLVDTYGKLGLVDFNDGDRGWAQCSQMRRQNGETYL